MVTKAEEQGKKWINALLAIGGAILAYILLSFFRQLGEWFDLEAKVKHFNVVAQGLSLICGLSFFFFVVRSKEAYAYLQEVFNELLKVVWAKREETFKLTIGIVVGVTVVSAVLGVIDYIFGSALGLLY